MSVGEAQAATLLNNSPTSSLPDEKPRKYSPRNLTRWRDWQLPTKILAIVAVPLITAIVLGFVTVAHQLQVSTEYQRLDRMVMLNSTLRTALDAIERERTQTVALIAQGNSGVPNDLQQTRALVDAALPPVNAAIGRVNDSDRVTESAVQATTQLSAITGLRNQFSAGQLDVTKALDGYSAVTTALINLDTVVVTHISDGDIAQTSTAVHLLETAKEETTFSQALINSAINRGSLTASEFSRFATAEIRIKDRITEFRAVATPQQQADLTTITTSEAFVQREQAAAKIVAGDSLGTSINQVRTALRQTSAPQWNDSSQAVGNALDGIGDRLNDEIRGTSAQLADKANSTVGIIAVLLCGALVLAAIVMTIITRQLRRSLRVLRVGAEDITEHHLPLVAEKTEKGAADAREPRPLVVRSADDVGRVADAVDGMQRQAIQLIADQVTLRANYGSVFVNLSRRSQSLVQRQLQLIERLERDEEDADQLATLFQLDHLATRMRRNNENVMVLSGHEPPRRSGNSVSLGDVVKAAVSEIEQYQRVAVQIMTSTQVVGYAANDVMRLVAELLDNATSFSAPDTHVQVAARTVDGDIHLDITDHGIGMNDDELTEANARLREVGSLDLATSRRMGLFVVARLAHRHNVHVKLSTVDGTPGIIATVILPSNLIFSAEEDDTSVPEIEVAPPVAAVVPEQSTMEISGTALFTPIKDDDDATADSSTASDELSPDPGLFAADETVFSDWWSETTYTEPLEPPASAEATGEETPIFTEALSAWFQTPESVVSGEKSEKSDLQWDLVSDQYWHAAQNITEAEPASFTESGLPRRNRGKQLLPGSATREAAQERTDEPTPHSKKPLEIKERLNSFQRGIRRGRQEGNSTQGDTSPHSASSSETPLTEAGLPRRRRGEQLMPASAIAPVTIPVPVGASAESSSPVRSAEDVRNRLNSFQRGARRGRHQASTATDDTSITSDPQAALENE